MLIYLQKTSHKRTGRSYIDSPKWLKKALINPKNKDNECFHYALTAALNFKNIESDPERISNLTHHNHQKTGKCLN